MTKRKWIEVGDDGCSETGGKRRQHDAASAVDRLSYLSDELILRTLSFLPVASLVTCQRCASTAYVFYRGLLLISSRLSHRFHTLSGDPQLWKSAYYRRFVRPRASRIPGIRDQGVSSASLFYSSRISKWLEDEHLVRKGKGTDWKRQYKLRHNWSRGSCDVKEIQIAERPSLPPMLVRLQEDIAITADDAHGLRVWTLKGSQRLLATLEFSTQKEQNRTETAPTSLAIDTTKDDTRFIRIAVGFVDGRFGRYAFDQLNQALACQYLHAASINGMVSALAYASPYLLTMTEAQLLSLYQFDAEPVAGNATMDPPRLLSSLKSHTTWPPLTLSIRVSSSSIIASVAYALPTYLLGWSVGLQELRLTTEGTMLQSRLASAANQGFTPLSTTSGSSTPELQSDSTPPRTVGRGQIPSLTKPTSLSYSHPYLLASHPDNTLTLYLVQSTDKELTIGDGSRLWGHTSSVSGAHVGDRGKAVSASTHGDEIRVWELEGGLRSMSSRRRAAAGETSVQIRAEKRSLIDTPIANSVAKGHSTAMFACNGDGIEELSTTKGFVAFDEEKVVVLRERGHGSQALVVFDFS